MIDLGLSATAIPKIKPLSSISTPKKLPAGEAAEPRKGKNQ